MAWGIKTFANLVSGLWSHKMLVEKCGIEGKGKEKKIAGEKSPSSHGGVGRWSETPTKILIADI